jgi:UDP-2,3-diacylglucosamine hydrolase
MTDAAADDRSAGDAVPMASVVSAPAQWRSIEFISDLHLAPDTPRTVEALRGYLAATDADAVFILGDLFEVWVGDDARDDAFEAGCVQLLAQASTRLALRFMRGNRDFLVGYGLLRAAGMQGLSDPTRLDAFGRSVLLTHGDALCLADADYQRFRTEVRDQAWQRAFLERPMAQRRAIARQFRDASQRRGEAGGFRKWGDVDPGAALAWLRAAGAQAMIHGHTHRPGASVLAPSILRYVLSDWDFDLVEASRLRGDVLRLDAAGLTRRSVGPPGLRGEIAGP